MAPPPASLSSFLESLTPFVQAFDFLLMIFCGFYCFRRSQLAKNSALRLMAIACVFSAIVLLGFFLSATYNYHAVVPLAPRAREVAYVVARFLAPFELLLFALAIVLVARRIR